MAEVWKSTLAQLRKDPSYRNMFHMMEQYGGDVAAEMTDKEGKFVSKTYNDYITESKTACGNLQRMGYGENEEVIGLIYDTCMDWPVLMWGILMSGNIPLLMNPGSEPQILTGILEEASAVAYVSAKKVEGCELNFIDAKDLLKDGQVGEERWGQYVALCTSGTTGNSRIFLYDAQTLANHMISFDEAKAVNSEMPVSDKKKSKLLAFLPFHHVFGFSVVYLLYSIAGRTLVYLKDKGVQTILTTCQKHEVTNLYCIPMFFNALATGITKQLGGKDVRNLSWLAKYFIRKKTLGTKIRILITGGGHIPESTLEVINGVGYPLYNGFGMTETGIISVERSLDPDQRNKGSIGTPFTLTEWKLDGETANEGQLYIRGDALYSATIQDGHIIPRDKSEWFGTGDVVVKKNDGLYIAGRVKDVIIGASGENIYPESIEDFFAGMPGVKNYCILGIKSNMYEDVSIVIEPNADFNRDKVITALKLANEKLTAGERVVQVFVSKQALPISGNMKIKRQHLKRMMEEGSWPCDSFNLYKPRVVKTVRDQGDKPKENAVARQEVTHSEVVVDKKLYEDELFRQILEAVKSLTAENIGMEVDDIGDTDHFIMTLGGDSLTIFSVFSALSEKFGIAMAEEEMLQLENCYEAARFTYCRLKGLPNEKSLENAGNPS